MKTFLFKVKFLPNCNIFYNQIFYNYSTMKSTNNTIKSKKPIRIIYEEEEDD